jgi:hypothetical protein
MKISTGSCGYGDIDPKVSGTRQEASCSLPRVRLAHQERACTYRIATPAESIRPQPHAHPASPRQLWPFFLVAGLNPANPLLQGLSQRGCGSCLEIECAGPYCHAGAPPVQVLITDECAAGCTSMQVRERQGGRMQPHMDGPPACTAVSATSVSQNGSFISRTVLGPPISVRFYVRLLWMATPCPSTQVNLHVFGFENLAPTDVGTTAIRYRRIACQPVDPITLHIGGLGPWVVPACWLA